MTALTIQDFEKLDKISRLNLINSCTGYKSANLIGTKGLNGGYNLAVFSSITHLGSDPALLGFVVRPTVIPRHTYKNIKDSGFFTVNHITAEMIGKAHQTSANYDESISEFDAVNLTPWFDDKFEVPFVAESPVKILCKYLNEYPIKENNTIHLIATIEKIICEPQVLQKDYWLRLDLAKTVAINGLDGYALPQLLDRFQYARPDQPLKSKIQHGSS
jgi:flavin reductase (DIM6/NTAB) family NADH-FMN oxidoreductase RutF